MADGRDPVVVLSTKPTTERGPGAGRDAVAYRMAVRMLLSANGAPPGQPGVHAAVWYGGPLNCQAAVAAAAADGRLWERALLWRLRGPARYVPLADVLANVAYRRPLLCTVRRHCCAVLLGRA